MKNLFEKMFTNTSEKARKMMYVIYCIILAIVIVVDVIAIITESLASGVSGFIVALVGAGIYTALTIIGIWMSFIMYFVFLDMSDNIKEITTRVDKIYNLYDYEFNNKMKEAEEKTKKETKSKKILNENIKE